MKSIAFTRLVASIPTLLVMALAAAPAEVANEDDLLKGMPSLTFYDAFCQ